MNHLSTSVRLRPVCLAVVIGFFLTMPSKVVHADEAVSTQNKANAETLYNEALNLMGKDQYAEACPKLVESIRLVENIPKVDVIGRRLDLANCYKQWGKLASAWALFIEAANEAQNAGQSDREGVAREQIAALEPRLPKLKVTVSAKVAALPGVKVRDNGTVLNAPSWGTALPVDPGEHEIVVSAPDRSPVRQTRRLAEGALETVMIEDLPAEPSKSLAGPIVLGSVGLAGIVVGSVFGVQTFSKKDAIDKECAPVCPKSYDDPLYDDARTAANVSTGTFIVGGVALAGAAIWLIAANKASEKQNAARIWVIPTSTSTSSGLVVGGAF